MAGSIDRSAHPDKQDLSLRAVDASHEVRHGRLAERPDRSAGDASPAWSLVKRLAGAAFFLGAAGLTLQATFGTGHGSAQTPSSSGADRLPAVGLAPESAVAPAPAWMLPAPSHGDGGRDVEAAAHALEARSPLPEFAGNYTATHMIEQAVLRQGTQSIAPELLQDRLFGEDGKLDSARLWEAWTTYQPAAVYGALKLSTNGMDLSDASGIIGYGAEVTDPDVPMMAAVCMAHLAFNDMAGKYLDLRRGVLPNFEVWTMPWGSGLRILGVTAHRDPDKQYRGFVVYGHDINPTPHPEEGAAAAFHELGHAIVDKGLKGPYAEEMTTEFLTTLWHPNTTDSSADDQLNGQYWLTAITAALDDRCRDTGSLGDLRFLDSDFPGRGPDGNWPPVSPGIHAAGIEELRAAFYGTKETATARVNHLFKQVTHETLRRPTGELAQTCPEGSGLSPGQIAGIAVGTAVAGSLVIGAVTMAVMRHRQARGDGEDGGAQGGQVVIPLEVMVGSQGNGDTDEGANA